MRAVPGLFPLYFVSDHGLNAGRSKLEVIAAALRGGARLIQFRDKALDDAAFQAEAAAALQLCRGHGATMLVNDRAHIAREIGADGVHLGQGDMPVPEARRLLGPEALIGLSTHGEEEVRAARDLPLTYINIGPMFPTGTKEHAKALGSGEALRLAGLWKGHWTTMGGIRLAHLPDLFRRGVKTAGMVTEISLAENPERKTAEILALIGEIAPTGDPVSASGFPAPYPSSPGA